MRLLRRTGSDNGHRQHRHGRHNARNPYAITVEAKGVITSQVDVNDHVLLGRTVCQACDS